MRLLHTRGSPSLKVNDVYRKRNPIHLCVLMAIAIMLAFVGGYTTRQRSLVLCPVGSAIQQPLKMHHGQEPVDVVVSWVDGSDPSWQARYKAAMGDSNINTERFVPKNEIFFCLASVQQFVPWVRKIHVITQQQSFDTSLFTEELRQKIVFVDHTQFMPATALPTFSSLALETRLHHIPDLSDHFIYLNDDLLFWRPLSRDETFKAGKFIVLGSSANMDNIRRSFPQNAETAGEFIWKIVYSNVAKLIRKKYAVDVAFYWHGGHFMAKKACESAWEEFQQAVNTTLHHKLRVYDELEDDGDVNFVLLAATLSVTRGYQTLDTSKAVWTSVARVDDGSSEKDYLAKVKKKPPKSILFFNFQNGLGDTKKERRELCFLLVEKLKGGFVEKKAKAFCERQQ